MTPLIYPGPHSAVTIRGITAARGIPTDIPDDLVDELKTRGWTNPAAAADEDGLIHVGGGVYELPDGSRHRGRDAALEALTAPTPNDVPHDHDSEE